MIGAIMARRQARATFARLNAHDLEGFVRAIADDVVIVWAPKSGAAGDRETRSRTGRSRTNAGCPRLRSWTSSC